MTTKAVQTKSIHSGSSFDDFLEEEGFREQVEAIAVKRVLAWQLSKAMKEQRKTKQAMARELGTSRSQLDRLLDPQNTTVSAETITRAASVLLVLPLDLRRYGRAHRAPPKIFQPQKAGGICGRSCAQLGSPLSDPRLMKTAVM